MTRPDPRYASRRQILGGVAALGIGALAGCRTSPNTANAAPEQQQSQPVPFYGTHQAGITTPPSGYLTFTTFDVIDDAGLTAVLDVWTAASVAMTTGRVAPDVISDNFSDSGEAVGANSSQLTITIGYGPTLFDRPALARRRPKMLRRLPPFSTDNLQDSISDGDIAVQICADDAQIAYHAHRQLTRLARSALAVRWTRSGFRGPQLGTVAKSLTRNLFGFHDGVQNPSLTDETNLAQMLWVQPTDQDPWMTGGTYLAVRRINMFTDAWDDLTSVEQQQVIGRRKDSGAPLSGGDLATSMNLAATAKDGSPAIAANAHIRLAAAANNGGAQILRRSYAFTDDGAAHDQAGQLFCAYQRDPNRGFIPIQRRLSQSDALNTHTQHVGSALFAVPPGLSQNQTWGAQLSLDAPS